MTSPDYRAKVEALASALRDVLLEFEVQDWRPIRPRPPEPIEPVEPPAGGSPFFHEPDMPVLCELRGGALVPDWHETWNEDGNAKVTGGEVHFHWPDGQEGGKGVGCFYHALANVRKVYIGARIVLCDGWQNHETGISKLFYIRTNDQGDMPFVLRGGPSGPYTVYAYPQFHEGASSGPWVGVGPDNIADGDYFVLEILIDMDANKTTWWVNGGAAFETSSIIYPPVGYGEFQLNPVWGGANDTKKHEDDILFSHFVLRGIP